MWYIYTVKYYSATKRIEVPICNTGNLKNMLTERSQTQNAEYCMTPVIGNAQNRKSVKTENRLEVAMV